MSPQRLQHLKFGEIEMKPVEENEKQLPEKENPESLVSGKPSKRSISRKSEPCSQLLLIGQIKGEPEMWS